VTLFYNDVKWCCTALQQWRASPLNFLFFIFLFHNFKTFRDRRAHERKEKKNEKEKKKGGGGGLKLDLSGGRNITTQAPSINTSSNTSGNLRSFRQQQHQ